ncbi:hypothetical protein [Gemmata sp. SH-PL17]|nr:hypothetical protein [Gemmata sp. SH-PL17]
MRREHWMVQFRKSANDKMQFKFCESRSEAESVVNKFKNAGYHASAWEL